MYVYQKTQGSLRKLVRNKELRFLCRIMSLYIASLNSGSNGNCYYVGNATDAVLVDVGISCREVERRMQRLKLDLAKVRAIFVSHEHGDHIKGVQGLSKKHNIPVYVTPGTKKNARLFLFSHMVHSFEAGSHVYINDLCVTPFAKYHDAIEPHSFTIAYNGITVGVITDIGQVCPQTVHHFKQCHAAFLESNYDEDMLERGRYPIHLKNRIRGGFGHISNAQALQLFRTHRPAHMSHLLLAHLSKENNHPNIVEELFNTHANGVRITVATRYEETPVFEVSGSPIPSSYVATPAPVRQQVVQVSLF